MATWTVTLTHTDGSEVHYTGSEPTPARARVAAIATTQARHDLLPDTQQCRYTIQIDGVAVAIVSTGLDDAGAPAHGEVAELLDALGQTPTPPALECLSDLVGAPVGVHR